MLKSRSHGTVTSLCFASAIHMLSGVVCNAVERSGCFQRRLQSRCTVLLLTKRAVRTMSTLFHGKKWEHFPARPQRAAAELFDFVCC